MGPEAAAWCERLTGLESERFSQRKLKRLETWVYADGYLKRMHLQNALQRVLAAVHPFQWPKPLPIGDGPYTGTLVTPSGIQRLPERNQLSVTSVQPSDDIPAYMRGDEQLENTWRHFEFPRDGCWRSTYRVNNRGRPTCKYKGEEWLVYALVLALADARLLSEIRLLMKNGI